MTSFLHRYELDTSAPTVAQAARDAAVRALAPAVLWWAVVVGLGLLITGPLDGLPAERAVSEWFAEHRVDWLDSATSVMSNIGATLFIITACVVAIATLWWRTRQWWFALVPGLAVALQALVFLTSSLVVGRERPEVEKLDDSPPTTAYPSGHTGASTAFYLTMAFLAQRIRRAWLRRLVTVLVLLVPLGVGTARLYRGMHSLTDVLVGAANGVVCALLAWNYLRRDTSGAVRSAG
ncbi:phosphatase PAP2 family protein [Cellulomonas massiliensis]|uniref:phosphatase PAP2 family protein n=1 Tax=Cellulomonas massiliensis TaxID=1465811 RepID=UPI00031BDB5C|nr:phosphatase PAP2 family protein [Cellulomonas massiliensis]